LDLSLVALDCALYRLSGEVSLIIWANKLVIEIEVFLNRSHDRRKLRFLIIRLFLPHRGKPQRINDSRRSSKLRITLYLRRLDITTPRNTYNPPKIGTQLAGKEPSSSELNEIAADSMEFFLAMARSLSVKQ